MTYDLLASTGGPQPRISKNAKGHTVCWLHKPVDFSCTVNDQDLAASLTHAEDDGTRWLYHVQFSDGHKAVFTINRKSGHIVEWGQHTPSLYAKAIAGDLEAIYQFNPLKPLPFCMRVDLKSEGVKVWARMEESGCWFVYFKGGPKFFLHFFAGHWQPEPLEKLNGYLVPEIITAVTERLNQIIKFTVVDPALLQASLGGGAQA